MHNEDRERRENLGSSGGSTGLPVDVSVTSAVPLSTRNVGPQVSSAQKLPDVRVSSGRIARKSNSPAVTRQMQYSDSDDVGYIEVTTFKCT